MPRIHVVKLCSLILLYGPLLAGIAVSADGQFSGWRHWLGEDSPAPPTSTEHRPMFEFKHHFIRSTMPTEDWFHSVTLADLDKDGDLDYTIASARPPYRVENNFYWYEYRGPDDWVEHLVGSMGQTQQAAALLDVDEDGWIDLVSGNHWYRNSGDPRNAPFTAHRYRDLDSGFHDVTVAEIDGDGRADIITLSENHGCYWYEQPASIEDLWPERQIMPAEKCAHGSSGPEGVGDLDGDGDIDMVSKTWRSGLYRDSANAGNAHADYLKNRVIVKPSYDDVSSAR